MRQEQDGKGAAVASCSVPEKEQDTKGAEKRSCREPAEEERSCRGAGQRGSGKTVREEQDDEGAAGLSCVRKGEQDGEGEVGAADIRGLTRGNKLNCVWRRRVCIGWCRLFSLGCGKTRPVVAVLCR